MKVLYFDTETTGLRAEGFVQDGVMHPGKICQLAYVIEEDGALSARNYYFAVDAIEAGASAVTGLTVPEVARLSGGHRFEEYVDEFLPDFATADRIVAHNLSFDERVMQAECARLGLRFYTGEHGFCTMRAFTPIMRLPGKGGRYKFPSLAEFARFYEVSDEEVMTVMRSLFDAEKGAHDARHDVVKMYLALDRACRYDLQLAAMFGKLG